MRLKFLLATLSVVAISISFFIRCSFHEDKLPGHWYLTKSVSDNESDYLEMKIGKDSCSINKDGMYWYRAEIEYTSDSIQIAKFTGKYEIFKNDSLVIYNSFGNHQFKRIRSGFNDITPRDLEMLRRFKYYAKHVSKHDTITFEMITNDMWYHFGNQASDSLEMNEDIRIIPNY